MKREKKCVQSHRTPKTFVYLYNASRHALKKAQREEPGGFFDCMAAILFCAFTLEAYLNDLGVKKIQTWAKDEEKLRPMDPDKFARAALDAVDRNEAIIILPSLWKVLWYLERASPRLSSKVWRVFLKRAREQLL